MSETARSLAADEQETQKRPELSVVPTAGSILQAARLQAGLSVEQVAEQLKLSLRQVNALEANQFEVLPTMVIVRGFVRSYAKLLKIDAESVLLSLPAEKAGNALDREMRPSLSTPFQESKTSFLARSENNNRKYIYGAIALALAALAFVLVQQLEQQAWVKGLLAQWKSGKTQEVAAPAEPHSEVLAPTAPQANSANPAQQQVKEATVTQTEGLLVPALPATVNQEPAVADPKPVTDISAQNQIAKPDTSTIASTAAVVNASDILKLKFKEDSWVQVKRENGPVLTARVIKAGSEESFEVKEGLQIKIGNGHGVEAWLRGENLPVTVGKDSKVVNLNIK